MVKGLLTLLTLHPWKLTLSGAVSVRSSERPAKVKCDVLLRCDPTRSGNPLPSEPRVSVSRDTRDP